MFYSLDQKRQRLLLLKKIDHASSAVLTLLQEHYLTLCQKNVNVNGVTKVSNNVTTQRTKIITATLSVLGLSVLKTYSGKHDNLIRSNPQDKVLSRLLA